MNPASQFDRLPPSACRCVVSAPGVYDGQSVAHAPGALRLDLGPVRAGPLGHPRREIRVLDAGPPGQVAATSGEIVLACDGVLIPGLVNAHTHLDLTHLGPRPPGGGFQGFVDHVRAGRHTDPGRIAASVALGVASSLRHGVVAVGDIAGAVAGRANPAAAAALRASGLSGVSFVEFFAVGPGSGAALQALNVTLQELGTAPPARVGVQPHAPYSVSLDGYARAMETGLPMCTHLAESPEEAEFIASGTGPFRAFQEKLGLWEASRLCEVGLGRSPIAHLAGVLARCPILAVHVNQADDRGLETLANTRTTVAYCPRASAYFGAESAFGPHRYRDMLRAGIPVAIGTDSVLNLPTPDLSIWDELRFLYARDATDPEMLLNMATFHGMGALGLRRDGFAFRPGDCPAGVVEVPGRDLHDALTTGTNPALRLLGSPG